MPKSIQFYNNKSMKSVLRTKIIFHLFTKTQENSFYFPYIHTRTPRLAIPDVYAMGSLLFNIPCTQLHTPTLQYHFLRIQLLGIFTYTLLPFSSPSPPFLRVCTLVSSSFIGYLLHFQYKGSTKISLVVRYNVFTPSFTCFCPSFNARSNWKLAQTVLAVQNATDTLCST